VIDEISGRWFYLTAGVSPVCPATACPMFVLGASMLKDLDIPMSPIARAVNDTFTFGPASERYYDHVEALDGITLGFGHWPQQEVEELFRDMSTANGGKAFEAFAPCAAWFFAQQNHLAAWGAARMTAHVEALEPTPNNVATVLRNTLLSSSL